MTAQLSDNPFSGAWLDRRSAARVDEAWLSKALADKDTRFILSCGTRHLVRRAPQATIAFLNHEQALVRAAAPHQFVLLGWYLGARCVLLEAQAEANSAGRMLPPLTELEELRPLLGELSPEHATLLACARALLIWRTRHRHCGVCGAPTTPRHAGHSLLCSASTCGSEFFPRLDPAIIVLVSEGPLALLGRQASWPAGRYSALAGFVEPGETLEDAVRREVREEVGVQTLAVRYLASQSWPFPASLMLGFQATASPGASARTLELDGELEDARWFSVAQIARATTTLLPPPYTIARRLIDAWCLQVSGTATATDLAAVAADGRTP